MISLTLCSIKTELCDELLNEVEQKFGISKKNCIVSSTHTHSGPNISGNTGWGDVDRKYYDEIFVPAFFAVIEKAMGNLQPVTMSWSRGLSDVGINRRELSKVGNHVNLGQNPWGPYNHNMIVLTFNGEDGKTVANMIHYGCHGTSAGANSEITRDWSGRMTDALGGRFGRYHRILQRSRG